MSWNSFFYSLKLSLFHRFFQGVQAISARLTPEDNFLYQISSTSVLSLSKQFGIPSQKVFPHIILISAACIRLVSTFFIAQHSDPQLITLLKHDLYYAFSKIYIKLLCL